MRTENPLSEAARLSRMAIATFGDAFSEHMVSMQWTVDREWHEAVLAPLGPIELHPGAACLHYGQLVFEGLKAYRRTDGSTALFRPLENARRFQRSARRLAMPELPEDYFMAAVEELLLQDRDWVPAERGSSLYLRPTLIATEQTLAVRPAREYRFLLLAFVTRSIFQQGRAITVWVSRDHVRAAPGGTGSIKCAGNYAAGYQTLAEAADNGCDQVLWLDAVSRRYVEELGAMNVFFVYRSGAQARLVTPPLTGTLLPGIVRDSLLVLARDLGIQAEERQVTLDEWRSGIADGSVTETFACGTGAVLSGVGTVRSAYGEWTIGDGQEGPVTRRLREALTQIHYGEAADPYGWMWKVG
jgi:branched-chain amino acid aminotransferase